MFLISTSIFVASFSFLNFPAAFLTCLIIHSYLNHLGNHTPLDDMPSQENKTYIITGVAENGIGYFTTLEILKKGATVILGCRNIQKTQKLIEKFKKETKNEKIFLIQLDMSSMESIKNFVREYKKNFHSLDVLVNNAGGGFGKGERSKDGFELTTAVNYIGLYCLTMELLDLLKKSDDGRILNTSSITHYFPRKIKLDGWKGKEIDGNGAYQRSKLYLNLFTLELQNRLNEDKNNKLSVFSFHPGGVYTEIWSKTYPLLNTIFSYYLWMRMMSAKQGAVVGLFLSMSPEAKKDGGKYFFKNKVFKENKLVYDENARKDLWNESQKIYKEFF
eukprot:gene1335-11417_t